MSIQPDSLRHYQFELHDANWKLRLGGELLKGRTVSSRRQKLFIASSVEGLAVARALQVQLDRDYEVDVWTDGLFNLSTQTLERLESKADTFDFAAFVLTPDDYVKSRRVGSVKARDNVIVELGLFIGKLGRRRCFIVHPRDPAPTLPTDFLGLTCATYTHREPIQAAVGAAATQIRDSVTEELRRLSQDDLNKPVATDYFDFRNLPLYDDEIRTAQKRIWIQSLRIKGFVDDHRGDDGARLSSALRRGVEIRILLPDPDLLLCTSQESRTVTSGQLLSLFSGEGLSAEGWHESIKRAVELVNKVASSISKHSRRGAGGITIRFHRAPVTTMVFLIDEVLYAGPYLIYNEAVKAPTWRLLSDHPLFGRTVKHFEDLWGDNRLSRTPEGGYCDD